MKILIDMNLSPRWTDTFTSAGFEAASEVLAGIAQMKAELEAGVLMTIDPKRTRIRLLPLINRE